MATNNDTTTLKELFDKMEASNTKVNAEAKKRKLFWEDDVDIDWVDQIRQRAEAEAARKNEQRSAKQYTDVIELVCALDRACPDERYDLRHIMIENIMGWGSEYNEHVQPPEDFEITPADMLMAENLKTLFLNKFVMKRLNGVELSEWEESVSFILNNPGTIKHGDIAKIVKLPLNYQNNLFYDDLEQSFTSCVSERATTFAKFEGNLKLIEAKHINYSRRKVTEIWFTDPETDYLLMLAVVPGNPLTDSFKFICESNEYVEIKGTVTKQRMRGSDFLYYNLTDFRITGVTPWTNTN